MMVGHDHLHRRHAREAHASPAPQPLASPAANPLPNPLQTLVSVVYVTAAPTFDGPIGGYSTLGVAPTTDAKPTGNTEAAQPTETTTSNAESTPTSIVADSNSPIPKSTTSKPTTLATSTGLPSAISSPSTTVGTSLAIAAATSAISSSSTSSVSAAAASASASSSPSSGGMTGGGKAGLAIGILLLIGAMLAIVLFLFKKRKDAVKQQQRLDDERTEKTDLFAGAGRASSTRTTASAPRLSLRPVTQFLPNLGEKRQSRGNALLTAGAPASAPQQRTIAPQSAQDRNRGNPFGNHAEVIDATNANGPAPVQVTGPSGEILVAGGAVAGAAAGAATIGLARGASKRGNGPKPMDFTKSGPFAGPPSPAGTEFSTASDSATQPIQTGTAAAIAAAGGPANSAVHRVQLDFKPSMEDELELRAGQLIRLLHEYDDGWALCIRLDRSQQGVVPRTCLSTRPVKPRPQQPRGPPPGMRGPQGQTRPMSPGMNGAPRGPPAMNQGPRPMSPGGRPMTPTGPQYTPQQGPMAPQGQGRPRSPSAAQTQARQNTPPGPSPMNPVAQPDGAASPPRAASPRTASPSGPPPSEPPPSGPPLQAQSPPPTAAAPVGRKPVPGQAL